MCSGAAKSPKIALLLAQRVISRLAKNHARSLTEARIFDFLRFFIVYIMKKM